MNKDRFKVILKYSFLFVLFLVWNLLITKIGGDELWNYGFAYNVSKGYLPYRDFSTIVPPFSCFLYAIPLAIFGHSILVLNIFNCFILLFMYYLLDKLLGENKYLPLCSMLVVSGVLFPCYNLILLVLFIYLLYLEKNEKSDYLIGVILALCVLTKHTVGCMLLLPSLFLLKKDKMKVYKRFKTFLIPCVLFLIYLIVSKTFYDFLDLCVFGLFDFASKNGSIFNLSLIFLLVMMIHIIFLIWYNKNNIMAYYALVFFSIAVPLFDNFHVSLAFLAYLVFLLSNYKIKIPLNNKLLFLGTYIGVGSITLYQQLPIIWPNDLNNFKYRIINSEFVDYNKIMSYYIKENSDYEFIFFNAEGYFFRIVNDDIIHNYDMNLYGNHGYRGTDKILNMILDKKNKSLIVVDKRELEGTGQEDKEAINYIINNAIHIDNIGYLDVYKFE